LVRTKGAYFFACAPVSNENPPSISTKVRPQFEMAADQVKI